MRHRPELTPPMRLIVIAIQTANNKPYADTQRRVIAFEIESVIKGRERELGNKLHLLQSVLDNRTAMLAEFVLRAKNILRAHIQYSQMASPPFVSAMIEYEHFMHVCAAYDGTTEETIDLWSAYVSTYRERISENNPLVYALRLWLGEKPERANQWVTPTRLFVGIQQIYRDIQQQLAYTAPNSFSRAVLKNLKPLQILGITERELTEGRSYQFNPDEQEMARCVRLYRDITRHPQFDPNAPEDL